MAGSLSLQRKVTIAARTLWWFGVVLVRVRRSPLPGVVERLRRADRVHPPLATPVRMGRIVSRTLKVGPYHARCLYTSMVLFRLLREQGEHPQLVIGLPREPRDKDAHAWVELDGRDVGPPPGRGSHVELARYGT